MEDLLLHFSDLLLYRGGMDPSTHPLYAAFFRIDSPVSGEDVKLPGTWSDMPFCVLGGNEVCSSQFPSFPLSMAGACFRQWHDKDVFGLYQGRLVPSQCANYDQAPYKGWMEAWLYQHCFFEEDWKTLCSYLDQHTELAAILVYPDAWFGAKTPECQKQFKEYLGEPVDQTSFSTDWLATNPHGTFTRVLRYAPRCIKAPR